MSTVAILVWASTELLVVFLEGPVTDGNCWAIFHENSSFEHRGSELNDGRLTMVDSDEECCRLCQKTPGIRTAVTLQPSWMLLQYQMCNLLLFRSVWKETVLTISMVSVVKDA